MTGDELREAEVGEQRAAGGVVEDVGGLDVPVQDPGCVRRAESPRQVARQAQNRLLRQRLAAIEEVGEGERTGGAASRQPGRGAGLCGLRFGDSAWQRAAQGLAAEAPDLLRREQDRPHGDERPPRGGVFAAAQHGQDRGMFERGEGARLAPEAFAPRGAVRIPHDLERDLAPERTLARQPDLPHAARAERTEELEVVGEDLAGGERQVKG